MFGATRLQQKENPYVFNFKEVHMRPLKFSKDAFAEPTFRQILVVQK